MAKRYALLFSSEDYICASRTPHCHADRELLTQTLTDACDYAPDDVISIALEKSDEKQPSLVMGHLAAIKGQLQAGDTVLFYYAGHGTSIADEPYLILPTTDDNNIEKTGLAIRDISNELRVDGVQCFRIFDSCHSGFDVRDGNACSEPLMRGVMRRLPDGWVTLAGCGPDESCYSSNDDGHGIFTSRIAQAIVEIEVGNDVRPESLKVRACELIDEWCATSGRVQTPTLIAAVRGNISLATRRAPIKPPAPIENPTTDARSPAELRARLLTLQGDAPPGSEEYWDRYKQIRDCLLESLEANRNLLDGYAGELSNISVTRLSNVTSSIETGVVDLIYKNGWRPLHNVSREVEVVRDEPSYASLLAIGPLGGGRTRTTTHRDLSEGYNQPESAIVAKLEPAGAIPGMNIIQYLCPLRTRFLAYTKVEITGVMNAEGTTSRAWYRLVAPKDDIGAKTHLKSVVDKAREMFANACEVNLKYLEAEQSD